MSTQAQHTYRARLDFLYQSIAVYAITIVLYLLVRSVGVTGVFPTLWQDSVLLLLSVITVASVGALVYNLLMRRQIEITPKAIRFSSRARNRTITRDDIELVRFGPSQLARDGRGVRVVAIRLKGRRRAVRIRLGYFENAAGLLEELRAWAGPLARNERRHIRALAAGRGRTNGKRRMNGERSDTTDQSGDSTRRSSGAANGHGSTHGTAQPE